MTPLYQMECDSSRSGSLSESPRVTEIIVYVVCVRSFIFKIKYLNISVKKVLFLNVVSNNGLFDEESEGSWAFSNHCTRFLFA